MTIDDKAVMASRASIVPIYKYEENRGHCHGIAYNASNKSFVTADAGTLRHWNFSTTKSIVKLPSTTTNFIQTLLYIPSKKVYVASALDGTLKLYDVHLKFLSSTFTHRAVILTIVHDITNNQLITGGKDGMAAWAIENTSSAFSDGHYDNQFELKNKHLFDKKFSSNQHWVTKIVLSAGKLYALWKNIVRIFDCKTGNILNCINKTGEAKFRDILVHPVSHCIVAAGDTKDLYLLAESISKHATSSIRSVMKGHDHSVTSLGVHVPSGLIISSSLDCTIRLWDIERLSQVYVLQVDNPVQHMLVIPPSNSYNTSIVCELESGVLDILELEYVSKQVFDFQYPVVVMHRSSSSSVVVLTVTGSIFVFQNDEWEVPHCIIENASDLKSFVGFDHNPTLNYLAILTTDNVLSIYSTTNSIGEKILTLKSDDTLDTPSINSLVFTLTPSVKGSEIIGGFVMHENIRDYNFTHFTMILGTEKGQVLTLDVATDSVVLTERMPPLSSKVHHILSSTKPSNIIATFTTDGMLRIWNSETLVTSSVKLHKAQTPSVIQHSDTRIICGYEDGVVEIYEILDTTVSIHSSEQHNHSGRVTSADFSSTVFCATSSLDGTIKLWDFNRRLIRDIKMMPSSCCPVRHLSCSKTSGALYYMEQNTLRVISSRDMKVLTSKLPELPMVFSLDNTTSTTDDSTMMMKLITTTDDNDENELVVDEECITAPSVVQKPLPKKVVVSKTRERVSELPSKATNLMLLKPPVITQRTEVAQKDTSCPIAVATAEYDSRMIQAKESIATLLVKNEKKEIVKKATTSSSKKTRKVNQPLVAERATTDDGSVFFNSIDYFSTQKQCRQRQPQRPKVINKTPWNAIGAAQKRKLLQKKT